VDNDHPDSLKSFITWIETRPWINATSSKLHCSTSVEQILLGLGLALQEYDEVHFAQDDDIRQEFPDYAHHTTAAGYNSIIRALKVVTDDIERSRI
jgi:hypothetical protein